MFALHDPAVTQLARSFQRAILFFFKDLKKKERTNRLGERFLLRDPEGYCGILRDRSATRGHWRCGRGVASIVPFGNWPCQLLDGRQWVPRDGPRLPANNQCASKKETRAAQPSVSTHQASRDSAATRQWALVKTGAESLDCVTDEIGSVIP